MNNRGQIIQLQRSIQSDEQFIQSSFFSGQQPGVSLRIGETGEHWKATGGLIWEGRSSARKQFYVVVEEFYDLRCLMNTLLNSLLFQPLPRETGMQNMRVHV